MEKRKAVSRKLILEAATAIVASDGLGALSMRSLASLLEIKAPSLYDHVKNRDAIIALIQAQGLAEFSQGFAAAGVSKREKVLFYREWALANPNLYPVLFQEPLHRDLLPEGLELEVLGQVVTAAGGSHSHARALWAMMHGLVDLELRGRFPSKADLTSTWEQAIALAESPTSANLAQKGGAR